MQGLMLRHTNLIQPLILHSNGDATTSKATLSYRYPCSLCFLRQKDQLFPYNMAQLKCQTAISAFALLTNMFASRSIVAVVMFKVKYPGWLDTYVLLKEAYSPLFGSVVFTGFPDYPAELAPGEKWVNCSATATFQYICFANAMQVKHSQAQKMDCTNYYNGWCDSNHCIINCGSALQSMF